MVQSMESSINIAIGFKGPNQGFDVMRLQQQQEPIFSTGDDLFSTRARNIQANSTAKATKRRTRKARKMNHEIDKNESQYSSLVSEQSIQKPLKTETEPSSCHKNQRMNTATSPHDLRLPPFNYEILLTT